MDRDGWASHKWSSPHGRRIEIEPGKPLVQHYCSRCKRDFAEDPSSGERYAVLRVSVQLSETPRSDYQTVARGTVSRRPTPQMTSKSAES